MSYEQTEVYVLSTDTPAVPIEGVVVKVFSQDGLLFYTQGVTDAQGKCSLLLPSNITYQSRFYKFGHSIKQPQFFQVVPTTIGQPSPNVFDIFAEVHHPPEATDPRLCLASGLFRSPSGGVGKYVDMHFIAKFDPLLLEGAPVLIERVSARTNDKGYVEVSLIRCGKYDVTLQGFENIFRSIEVPDQPWVNIGDLLFPRVKSIVYEPSIPGNSITLAVGASVTYDVTVATTARYNLSNITTDVLWRTDDFTKVSFQLTPTTITIKALAVGTTNIRAERRDTTTISIPNTPVENGVLEVVVV